MCVCVCWWAGWQVVCVCVVGWYAGCVQRSPLVHRRDEVSQVLEPPAPNVMEALRRSRIVASNLFAKLRAFGRSTLG